jgi:hypothetical protein
VCELIDREVLPAVGELAARTAAAIHQRPETAPDGDGHLADTVASCDANLRVLTTLWRTGGDPRDARPPAPALAYARVYAREARPFSDLLRAYRVGQEELLRILRHELGARLSSESLIAAIDQVSEFVFVYNDAIVARLEEAYEAERAECERTAVAMRRRMLAAVLDGSAGDEAEASRLLGYDLRRIHLAAVLWGAPEERLEEAASEVARSVGARRHLTAPLGANAIAAWFGAWDEPDLGAVAPPEPPLRLAFGRPAGGIEGFRTGHAEARRAHQVALVCEVDDGVVSYRDVALAGLLSSDREAAREFARAEIGPLLEGPRPETLLRLRETVGAFFAESSSVSRTARRLGIHENTVHYRLNGAAELLGHPLEERPLELALAVEIARLLPPSSLPKSSKGEDL